VHADIDLPLDQLVKKIPDLAGLHPAQDERQLPLLLKRIGQSVDAFVQNIGDLIAREDLTQERLSADGKVRAKHHVEDNYLILRRGYSWGANAEYRMDDKGNRLEQVGLDQGYLVTAGHALSCIQFSTVAQSQSKSRFRYLGTEMLGASDTYVLAFAQDPGDDNFARLWLERVQKTWKCKLRESFGLTKAISKSCACVVSCLSPIGRFSLTN